MIRLYALVGLGGAIGSMARFWLASAVLRLTGPGFPWGTVLVNTTGSVLIGWLSAVLLAGRPAPTSALPAFAMAGVCGGFTTFSAFSLQTVDLLRTGRTLDAVANICASLALCVGGAFAGLLLGR